MEEYETKILVIGAGSCGSLIAIKLREYGLRVMLVEMEEDIGGVLRILDNYAVKIGILEKELSSGEYLSYLRTRIYELGIPLLTSTTIIDLFQDDKYFYSIGISENGVRKIRSEIVILAVGGREINQYDLLITGTRPAGIFTGLMALNLIKKFNKRIGRKAVIYTNNDIGLLVAHELIERDIFIDAVVMNKDRSDFSKELVEFLEDKKIEIIEETEVSEVKGINRLESIKLRHYNGGEEIRENIDTLIISMGFLPNIELATRIGAKIDYETKIPILTKYLESSIPNLFICGLASGRYLDINDAINKSAQLIDNIKNRRYITTSI